MNLAFYVNTTNSSANNLRIYKSLNKVAEENKVDDAILFFNNVDFMSIDPKFGLFDGQNIWNFQGNLVCTDSETLAKAKSAVNKFKIGFLYDKSQPKQLYNFLFSVANVKIFTLTQEDRDDYYRITGDESELLSNLEDLSDDKKWEASHE